MPEPLEAVIEHALQARLAAETHPSQEAFDAAVAAWRLAAGHPEASSSVKAGEISVELAGALWQRYSHDGDPADLDESITILSATRQTAAPDSRIHALAVSNLATNLKDRYDARGDLADLETALALLQEVASVFPAGSPDWGVYQNKLGGALKTRFEALGDPADIDAAIEAYKVALIWVQRRTPLWIPLQNGLGNSLRTRFDLTGRPEDLQEAHRAFERALAEALPGSRLWGILQGNQASVFSRRFLQTGEVADLDASIEAVRKALDAFPPGYPARADYLANLGVTLRDRYDLLEDLDDLAAAIDALREALELRQSQGWQGSADQVRDLASLGRALADLYTQTGDASHIELALASYRFGLEAEREGSPTWVYLVSGLGDVYMARYNRERARSDLRAARECIQEAIRFLQPGSPAWGRSQVNLGMTLHREGEAASDPAGLDAAVRAYRDALGAFDTQIQPREVFQTATLLGRLHASRREWAPAAEALSLAARAVDRLYATQVLQAGRDAWLMDAEGLSLQLAFALAHTGQTEAAVLALERGRARGLRSALQRDRADLSHLQQSDPYLYQAYVEAAGRLRSVQARERREAQSGDPPSQELREAIRLADADLDRIASDIQALPAYAGFLALPEPGEIRQAAQPGVPLAYLACAPEGSLVLLVPAHPAGPVEALFAEDFTVGNLKDFLVRREAGEVTGGYLPGQLGRVEWLTAALETDLPRLGEHLVSPLSARLRAEGAHGAVLIPCGLLALLPLAAAPYGVDGQVRCLLDEFDISFAPSAGVLLHSRGQLALAGHWPDACLVVDPQPLPHGFAPLSFAALEAAEIRQALQGSSFETGLRELPGEAATLEAFSHARKGAAILHLACHGLFEPERVMESGLVMSGGERLSLGSLLESGFLENIRLAVLSACQTAVTRFDALVDEAIGLPAGFLQAGAAGVVGTLWPVDDISTALLVGRFYSNLFLGDPQAGLPPIPPVQALRHAQLWLRRATAGELADGIVQARREGRPYRSQESIAWRRFSALDRCAAPFSSPYFWAGFTYNGS